MRDESSTLVRTGEHRTEESRTLDWTGQERVRVSVLFIRW